MAEDARAVEQDLQNDAAALGGEELAAAIQAALTTPIGGQQEQEEPPSGGFFSPPQRFVDLSNSPRRQAVDFSSAPFSPGLRAGPISAERTALEPGANTAPYVDTDAPFFLGRMDSAILARLQDRMAALGLNVGQRGIPDNETKQGFRELLAMANSRGEKWTYTLAELEKRQSNNVLDPTDGEGGRSLPGYVAPDYTSVGLEVRNRFRQALGRDPTEGELRLFSDELMTGVSTQRRREAEAAADQTQPLTGPDIGTPDLVSADEVGAHGPVNQPQQGNPMARFEELFAQKVSGEEELLRRSDEESASAGLARSNIERSAGGA